MTPNAKTKKKHINFLGNKIKKSPTDQSLRKELSAWKKEFKRTVMIKKRRYKENMVKLMESKRDRGLQRNSGTFLRRYPLSAKKIQFNHQ